MGWLAWSGGGDSAKIHPSVTNEARVPIGAMVLEAPLPTELRAATLLEVSSLEPEPCLLRIQSIPGEGFSILISRGTRVFHALISHTLRAKTTSFRLTFNWNAKTGDGLLSIEHPGEEVLFTSAVEGCLALPGSLIQGALNAMRSDAQQGNLAYIGFHQGPWAIGPNATLDYHTPILTPRGYREAGTLCSGDTVVTGSGEIVPVLASFRQTVPAFGSFASIRLRAPYFGLQCDLVMGGMQRLIVGGSDVEYTFGRDTVLIPALHLVNGTAAVKQPTTGLATYFQLLLPENQSLIASELEVESLFIGRLRRRKEIFAHTTVAQIPRNLLPEHALPDRQVLKPFEAITLAAMRAA